jgi:DNA-binding NarL/FixJ family response regulator
VRSQTSTPQGRRFYGAKPQRLVGKRSISGGPWRELPSRAANGRTATVVIVDDEPLIRTALARSLMEEGFAVVGAAGTGETAIEIAAAHHPDVVLMDIRLPGLSGIETIAELRRQAPASRVLVLTRPEQNQIIEAIIAGASGYMLKNSPSETIVSAVRKTAQGRTVLDPDVVGTIVQRICDWHISISVPDGPAADQVRSLLTERELEVFALLATGESNHGIGRELGLSNNTVANHVKSILNKLQLQNRIQAAAHAVRVGISA